MAQAACPEGDGEVSIIKASDLRAGAICFLIIVGCILFGAVFGIGAALLALGLAEGDGRGAPFLVIGIALFAGAGLGFVGGLVWSLLWLQRRVASGVIALDRSE